MSESVRNADDFCYRHPDRRSFVLCQRCLRTICPECQTQAAVGVICPECMREQTKAQPARVRRAARTLDSRPLVTYWIMGVTAVVFALQWLVPGGLVDQWLALYPPLLYPSLSGVFQPWRLFTVLLVHSGFLHIALNMLALWMLGRVLEPMLGHARFLATYLIAGLGGSVAAVLFGFDAAVVGASGAIFGLLGVMLVIGRHLGADVTGILVVLGLNLVIGFLPGANVSWQAHIGGALTGAVIGLIFVATRSGDRVALQRGLLAGLVVALVAALAIPLAIPL